ncbi:nucleotidyltransferase [Paenibacillus sp. CCS19]|uniref:aminoglycoside adenylyltransferase domain-containing protein n=1 Tax=Paenibacillus sp. CCS19 TaxID=3158387 RepID=UPI002564826F|nr:aminoglycoside adenylyltransferase domain-containing protein [Paenibacillus cellulosilyticus]GMK41307.1 nucleotidyltransferase [Paenibacillus cellulosilyticus]
MVDKLPPRVQEVLTYYLEQINKRQAGLIQGFYLYGSIALDDYYPHCSDIDFVAVTEMRLTDEQYLLVMDIHKNVEKRFPSSRMGGIYVTWADMGKLHEHIEPFPYYSDGKLKRAGYFELNLVTWYELKHHGIRLIGPAIEELALEIDMNPFIRNMHINLNTYWANWIHRATNRYRPYSYIVWLRGTEIEWGVLGITRLWYTFREHQVTSKAGAGKYALAYVPEQWHLIVQECIRIRRGEGASLYRSRAKRKADAIAYMQYIMKQCNEMFT